MNIRDLATTLEAAQRARRLSLHSKAFRPDRTHATALGYRCERRIVYARVLPDLAAPIGEELSSIFEEGNLHQADVRRELAALGFEVVEAEVNFRDAALEISGTIDGKIEAEVATAGTAHSGKRRVPVEIKSTSGSAPTDAESWRTEDGLLGRYYAQIQTYLYLCAEPEALGIFKAKITGLWSVVPVALDYDYAEGLIKRAERVRDAVALYSVAGDEALPERLADRSECDGCPWRDTACHPAEAPVDPLLIAGDLVLRAQIAARQRLESEHRNFETIDAKLKERFRLTRGDRFVVGTGHGGFLVCKKLARNGAQTITFSNLGVSP